MLSACAGTVEMVRDVARTLADIDLGGVADVFGWQTVEMSPEQAAQLSIIPGARPLWQNLIDESQAGAFSPVFDNGAVYGTGVNGRVVRFDAASGRETASVDTQRVLSGGIGAGDGMLLVATFKGEVLAFDEKTGKALWTAQVSSEVLSPPRAEGGMVVVRAGDGRIFSLDAATGKRKWVYQGATPSLTVRNFGGVLISRGMVFAGFAGGKLIAINLSNGSVTWEAVVSRPRGATELERITDVTSLPVMDEHQICAVAYQGRVACFDIATGNQIWARDVSSNAGLAMDNHYVYVSEERGAIVAYDKNDGTSVWRQEMLSGVKLSPPLVRDNRIVVADSQGYVNLIRNSDGVIVGRSATDGSAIITRPVPLPDGFVVQTRKGGLYALSTETTGVLPPPGVLPAAAQSPQLQYLCSLVPFCKP
ncbi:Beta-barrel assembly machine subunit BamB [Nitrosovibrio tenuis]|uniref:Outer membrane protein assembly factor BamB n=2 Tax=Nitrosovibrio tenuis TaxID=1233 RepID=A0A1H7GGE7_9PROT|nr:Beta-barrel assembly machine subunit BamB [Nitrosovibrio tenuis]